MLSLLTSLQSWLVAGAPAIAMRNRARDDAGQATAEYALVLVGAAAVAVLLIGWATKTDRIGKLLDLVVDNVSGRVK
jgi:Flp pilus assembly pilin Flp